MRETQRRLRWVQRKRLGYRGWAMHAGTRVYFPVRATAEEAHRDALQARAGQSAAKRSRPRATLADGFELVRESLATRGRRGGTLDWYECQFRALERAWDPRATLGSFDRSAVEWFIDRRRAQGVSASTIAANLRALGRVFRLAVGHGWVERSPLEGVERPTPGRTHHAPLLLTEAEDVLERLRAQPGAPSAAGDADLAELLLRFGLRRSEAAGVLVEDADLERGVLEVRQGKTGARALPIVAEARPLVARMLEAGGPGLLPGETTARRQGLVSRSFARWQRRFRAEGEDELAERWHAHALRHALATHLDRCGVRTSVLALVLGHRLGAQSITHRYVTPHTPELVEALGWAWYVPAE